jgi:hypothetical protein
MRVVYTVEYLHSDGRWPPGLVYQKQLLLAAYSPHARFEPPFIHHLLKGPNVPQQVPYESAKLIGVDSDVYVLLAHDWFLPFAFI